MINNPFISIEQAIQEFREGKMLVLVDDENRENEGDLIIAADKITAEAINFLTKHGRGLICMPVAGEIIDRLNLPQMVKQNKSRYGTAFTVSIGSAQGITTGISTADRAHTVRTAIDPRSTAADIVSPGHIFPLRAVDGGVLSRQGHTEGCVDLARLAGLQPGAVLCEVMNDDGTMARLPDLIEFSKRHHISLVSIEDLITYRIMHETIVNEISSASLPLFKHGEFQIKLFENVIDGTQHLALIKGNVTENQPVLTRIHSQCITGDIFGSARCDCGAQLDASLERINKEGGILLYMNQEGRGIGLANKLRAYSLQDKGLDTVEANHHLGFPADQRDYGIAVQILQQLNVKQIRLLTNNPQKIADMKRYGLDVVAREAIETTPTNENITYLRTKMEKLGHLLTVKMENQA